MTAPITLTPDEFAELIAKAVQQGLDSGLKQVEERSRESFRKGYERASEAAEPKIKAAYDEGWLDRDMGLHRDEKTNQTAPAVDNVVHLRLVTGSAS